jgi:hypothetical protein
VKVPSRIRKHRNPSVTESLQLGGAVDYSFCTEEAKWRGGEVHYAALLLDQGVLVRRSVKKEYRGYLDAYERGKKETHFIPVEMEGEVYSEELDIYGHFDRIGYFANKSLAIADLKTCKMPPATALQLALYGWMKDPSYFWPRFGWELSADGRYSFRKWSRSTFKSDLEVAKAVVRRAQGKSTGSDEHRIANWKRENHVR